ncbi:MAG: tetratricopeptide repeat protein [Proteobacteria bacterium]|nr:tetratricopeptide repeat protein [Pseudomonadota bacterium]MBU1742775.1 tetratricopeptide repeat protein [Pseudomonadota bacterium]
MAMDPMGRRPRIDRCSAINGQGWGRDEAVREDLEQGLESSLEDVHLYNRLGIAFRKQGKIQEAIENDQRALKIEPDNQILFYNLGRACPEAGDNRRAIQAMIQALQI